MNRAKHFLRLLVISLMAFISITTCGSDDNLASLSFWNGKHHKVETNIDINSFDGTQLKAQVYTPSESRFPGLRPTVIFVNSWAINEYQYTFQAKRLAEKGYLVLSYATRGFGGSGGLVGVAGEHDIQDVSGVIDWLLANTKVDPKKIAIAGVSYGGGIAFVAAAKEKRISLAAGLSSWADLKKALYADETVRNLRLQVLIGSGELTGRIDPEIKRLYQQVKNTGEAASFMTWAKKRSAEPLVDLINKRDIPIFVSNNYDDDLFPPNNTMNFFNSLTTPKKFYANKGLHASAEIPGLLGQPSPVWDGLNNWLDAWFLGQRQDAKESAFMLQTDNGYENYSSARTNDSKFDVKMKILNKIKYRPSKRSGNLIERYVPLKSMKDSGASTGIPLLSAYLRSHTPINLVAPMNKINLSRSIYLRGYKAKNNYSLRGIPGFRMRVLPKDSSIHLVAYLYLVNRHNFGKLVSHAVFSKSDLKKSQYINVDLEFKMLAIDVEPGYHLALVIDSHDLLYSKPQAVGPFDLIIDPDTPFKLNMISWFR